MLAFYGLSLLNASKYTCQRNPLAGLTQMTLGVVGALIPNWGLALWAAGFGGVHIVYGLRIFFSYEK